MTRTISRPLHRRTLLRGAGVALGLPGKAVQEPVPDPRRQVGHERQPAAPGAEGLTQPGTSRARVASGTEPWPRIASWNARRSNRGPSRCSRCARRSWCCRCSPPVRDNGPTHLAPKAFLPLRPLRWLPRTDVVLESDDVGCAPRR